MERYGKFGDMFEMSNKVRESQEFHLDESESQWLKRDIKAFMEKYGVRDWDQAVSMYATHNVLPEEKVRAALGESKLQEESEEEEHAHMKDTGEKEEADVKDDSDPDDEMESPKEPTEEDVEDAYNYYLRSANASSDPIRNNAKTGVSIDFDMECPHRKRGEPCGYCYVENGRKQARAWIGRMMKQGGLTLQQVKDNVDAKVYVHIPGPGYKRSKKAGSITNKSRFSMGAQTPSMITGRVEYKPGTLQRKRKLFSPENIKKFNAMGGVRIYSFSDYNPEDDASLKALFDDADAIGLKLKAITKSPDFIKKWSKRTGVTNLSVDNVEQKYGVHSNSLSLKDAAKMRNDNVKVRVVAFTPDEAIEYAKNPNVDIVTPFHGHVKRLPVEMQDAAKDMKHGTDASNELMKRIKTELSSREKGKFCCYTGKCETCKVGCGKGQDPCEVDWDAVIDAIGESVASFDRQGWVDAMWNDEKFICESYEGLVEQNINEQDEEELIDDEEEPLPEDEDIAPEDEALPEDEFAEEDFVEEEGAEIPVPEDKEYVGKSDDKHFYMVPEKNDQGDIIDMKIVDQEENQLFSAEENNIDPTDMSLFLNTVFRDSDVGIAEIDRQVIVKYVIPAAEQEQVDDMEDEDAEMSGEDLPVEDEFAEEEGEEDLGPEGEGDFEGEGEEDLGPEDEEMPEPKKKKNELLRPMESRRIKEGREVVANESKLTEKKVAFDGHVFDVQLVDEGAKSTTISINGREFSYTSEFASMFQEDGALTESGMEELAMDALSTLEPDEFDALAEASDAEDIEEGSDSFDDPTKEEMLVALKSYMDEDGAGFDSEAAIYWYANDYHGGQSSNLYSVLSTSDYSPGASMSSVGDEGDLAEMMYRELEDTFGGESKSDEEEEETEDKPQEDDIFLSSVGHLGGQTQVSSSGKVIGTFSEEGEAMAAAKAYMEQNQYYSSVWMVSDHGNYHKITLGDEGEDDMKKTKESKVHEEGEFKHVFLVKYVKDDGEDAEMKVEALDVNDAKRMIKKRAGVKSITGEPKQIGEAKEMDEALSRKYYVQFANMVKEMDNRDEAKAMATQMAEMFESDNSNFDRGHFMEAAGAMETDVEESEVDETELDTERMMPGQKPYTDKEKKKRDRLVADAADEDPGEANEANEEVTDEKCGDEHEEDVEEGSDEPGKRDGTGPYKKSRRAEMGMEGMRKSKGESCPNESKAVFASTDKRVKDAKDHFPITSENLATKALIRVAGYEKVPAWFEGTVEELQEAVKSAVAEVHPSVKIEESKEEEVKAPKKLDEANDPAFGLAQELLGLNESVDEMDEIKVGIDVTIIANQDMRVMHECVKVAQVNEHGVEVTGEKAEMDQVWFRFDNCQIYPV